MIEKKKKLLTWQSEDGLQRDRNQVENSHDPYYCPHNGE